MQQSQNNFQSEISIWAKSAPKELLIKKRNRLDVIYRHSLHSNEDEVKTAISILDGEMNNRSYHLQQQGLLVS